MVDPNKSKLSIDTSFSAISLTLYVVPHAHTLTHTPSHVLSLSLSLSLADQSVQRIVLLATMHNGSLLLQAGVIYNKICEESSAVDLILDVGPGKMQGSHTVRCVEGKQWQLANFEASMTRGLLQFGSVCELTAMKAGEVLTKVRFRYGPCLWDPDHVCLCLFFCCDYITSSPFRLGEYGRCISWKMCEGSQWLWITILIIIGSGRVEGRWVWPPLVNEKRLLTNVSPFSPTRIEELTAEWLD